tara:strand:- start:30 stop:512 length:483 start_codon:yes stop_codon:yes gene_type:complete
MAHEPGHLDAEYVIYGTNIPYTGRVIQLNNNFFGTESGALEGDSPRLAKKESGKGKSGNVIVAGATSTTNNPVTRTFQAPQTPRYRRSDNNQLISIGYKLHQHADGTIMTEHSMGPNDNSVVVTEVLPQTRRTTVRSGTTPRGGTTSRSGGTGGGMGGGY